MTPDFLILANGGDVTATLRDRLISLEISDEDGTKSDQLGLAFDDRDGALDFPDMETVLEVFLGFKGAALIPMGRFAVDGVSGEGPAQVIEVTATPADMKGAIRAPQTRSWQNVTLGDIAAKIAGEAGLKPVVSESITGQLWDYLAQTAESNLHFLTRIAATLDATAKPAGGALVVSKRGEGKTAAGEDLPPVLLTRAQLSNWRWQLEGRASYRKIEAEWSDAGSAKRHKITRGQGTPIRRLRHIHACEADAVRAAEAELSKAERASLKISVQVAGFAPELMAGGTVSLNGLRPELDGVWHLTRVRHRLANSLTTEFEATKGAPK